MKASRYALGGLLLLIGGTMTSGCRWASGPGDTVETPPRALVEKTFRPPPPAAAKGAPDNPNRAGASGSAGAK